MANELGDFLRARRALVQPQDVGVASHGRRRVPGLRRDELARLAGVSVEYYTRLEQGRGPSVSDSVLDAIAAALRLDPTEHAHLRELARPGNAVRPAPRGRQIRQQLRLLLDSMDRVPAFVLGRRMDILAWNRLGDAVSGFSALPAAERNVARQFFLEPASRELYPDWSNVAAEVVGYLRLDAGRYPDDPALAALVGTLSIQSETFRELWASHRVRDKAYGPKRINHPVVGELDLRYETLTLPAEPDQLLVSYLAEPGSATEEKLSLLASWTADQPVVND